MTLPVFLIFANLITQRFSIILLKNFLTCHTHITPILYISAAVDAYERFVLEADFRQSLVLSSPLDIYLLDLAYAFFAASVKSHLLLFFKTHLVKLLFLLFHAEED